MLHELRPAIAENCQSHSSHGLLLFRSGDTPRLRLSLELGLGQEPEASLAPREINTDVEQSIGPSARTCEFHDRSNYIGLANNEGHSLSRHMVWRCIDAQNQIAGADGITHGFHPLR
jgi:hypothetical protein